MSLPSLAALTIILLQEETRQELRGTKRIKNKALLVKNGGRCFAHRKPGDEGKKQKKPGSNCHYCGKKDHWLCNCPDNIAELKRRRASQSEKSSMNLVDNFTAPSNSSDSVDDAPWPQVQNLPVPVDEPDLALNVSELHLADQEEEWYIDSRASRHVTGKKYLLSNIARGSRSKIGTAGGERLHVIGNGSVEIPTTSGSITLISMTFFTCPE